MLDLKTALAERHSVRSYQEKTIPAQLRQTLEAAAAACNQASGLHLQWCWQEPQAFQGKLAHYGKFQQVQNYLCLVGPKGKDLQQRCGFYGEHLVGLAAQLGLNTCWVGLTYQKKRCACEILPGEKLCCVIAIGYGVQPGVAHKSKPLTALYQAEGTPPPWFLAGMAAAALAPTAMNQQKFRFQLVGQEVSAQSLGGFYSQVDLGIVKYHFAVGAGEGDWQWAPGQAPGPLVALTETGKP